MISSEQQTFASLLPFNHGFFLFVNLINAFLGGLLEQYFTHIEILLGVDMV